MIKPRHGIFLPLLLFRCSSWVHEAIDHLPKEFEILEVAQACHGVSRPIIRAVMENLRKQDKIEVLGTGRGAKWRKVILSDKRDNKKEVKG